jgi:hypothetical protein
MAPEVIQCDPDSKTAGSASYTDKSDIWSLGITAIEIAEKNPPLSDIHPMQALTMIASHDIAFSNKKEFTKLFVEFVMSMIVKNPTKRPTSTQCLAHPFMVQASNLPRDEILMEVVNKMLVIKEKKKKGLEITEEDEIGAPQAQKESENATSEVSANPTDSLNKKAKSIMGHLISQSRFATKNSNGASNISGSSTDGASIPSISEFPTVANNVQEGITCIFEPVILTTLHEILTADFLDGKYILIGTEKGLFYLDIQKPSLKVPIPLIADIRFRQIQVLAEYNVLIALSGKHDHIRQYSLGSIRKLILFIEGNESSVIAKTNTNIPMQSIQLGQTAVTEYDYLNQSSETEEELLMSWANDYVKILNTRDTREFIVELTEATAYLCILGQGITLFRWAVEPYKKFMKIKSFWVPETPKFVTLTNDGMSVTELFVGYSSEFSRVGIHDSKVTELKTHKEMKAKASGKQRWQSFVQIPFTEARLEQILKENSRSTVNRKLAALTGPTLSRPTNVSDRYFLGTYHRLTKVVDKNSFPMIGSGVGGWKDGVMWSELPIKQILRPLQHVITVGKNTIEIVEWKSAGLRQRMTIESSCNFRVLSSSHGQTLIAVDKKKIGSMLYWMMESSPPPRAVGDIISSILKDQTPINLLDDAQNDLSQRTELMNIKSDKQDGDFSNASKSIERLDENAHTYHHTPPDNVIANDFKIPSGNQAYSENSYVERELPPVPQQLRLIPSAVGMHRIGPEIERYEISHESRMPPGIENSASYSQGPRNNQHPRPTQRPFIYRPRPGMQGHPINFQGGPPMNQGPVYRPLIYQGPRYQRPIYQQEPIYGTMNSQVSSTDPRFSYRPPPHIPGYRPPPIDPRFYQQPPLGFQDPRYRPDIRMRPQGVDQRYDFRTRPIPPDPRFYRPLPDNRYSDQRDPSPDSNTGNPEDRVFE